MSFDSWMLCLTAVGAVGGIAQVASLWLQLQDRKVNTPQPNATPKIGKGVYISRRSLLALSFFMILLVASATSSWYLEKPALRAELDEMSIGQSQDGMASGVFLHIVIFNVGSPTVVGNYELCTSLIGGARVCGERMALPPTSQSIGKDGTSKYIYGTDDLNAKTTLAIVPRGGAVGGILWFTFPRVSASALNSSGVEYNFTFQDAWGKRYGGKLLNSGLRPKGEVAIFPYVRDPRRPPPEKGTTK